MMGIEPEMVPRLDKINRNHLFPHCFLLKWIWCKRFCWR